MLCILLISLAIYFYQKLSKSAHDQQCHCKNKKGVVFLKHSVLFYDVIGSEIIFSKMHLTYAVIEGN